MIGSIRYKVLPGDGVVTGTGTIFGAPVCIYAQDFTVAGGSLGLQHARNWSDINTDIFGNMFQACVAPDKRSCLGEHTVYKRVCILYE